MFEERPAAANKRAAVGEVDGGGAAGEELTESEAPRPQRDVGLDVVWVSACAAPADDKQAGGGK